MFWFKWNRFPGLTAVATLVVALVAAPAPGPAQEADLTSPPGWLPDIAPVLDRIPSDNALVKALQYRADAQNRMADAARALPDPMLGIGLQAVPTDFDFDREPMTQRPVVSLRQAIPFGPERRARRDAGRSVRQAIAASRADRVQAFAADLAAAAFDLARLQVELAAVTETIAWERLLLGSVRIRYRSGRGMAHDVAQLQVDIARLETEYSQLLGQLGVAKADWRRVLGAEVPSDLPTALTAPEAAWRIPANVTDVVLAGSPRMQRLLAERDRAESELRLARAGWGPDLVVEGGYGVRGQGRRDFLTGRVGISVPLWGGMSQKPRVEAAELRLAAIEAELEDLRRSLRASTDRLIATHKDLVRREAIYTGSILGDARFARTSARATYEGGGADVFVPIEATARYLRAEREYARLVAMRRSVEARLLALSGRLAPVRTRPTPSEDQLVGDSE